MFCQNCGNQIPDNTKFCSHCGAMQNVNGGNSAVNQANSSTYRQPANTQPTYTSPQPSQKPPQKKIGAILLTLVVILGVFLVGKFIFAPGAVSKFEESVPNRPAASLPQVEQNKPNDGSRQQKTFIKFANGVMSSSVTFSYSGDTVNMIGGEMIVYDDSKVDVAGLKRDAQTAKQLAEEYGLSHFSIQENENAGDAKYAITFVFSGLDQDPKAAELAAQYIGFSAQNGKISIVAAEQAMIGFGYSLQ